MISISKRLKCISTFIDDGDNIIDIGCDHALLDIYLVQTKKDISIIASDILNTAIDGARANISEYRLSKRIDLRCSNGLDSITDEDNINTIIMAGMGYQKIISILLSNIEKLKNVNKIVLQCNNNNDRLRLFYKKIGYYISNEKLVKDGNIIYTVCCLKKGIKKYNKLEIKYGPIILKNKDKVFYELIDIYIKRNLILLDVVPKKHIFIRFKIKQELKELMLIKKV